jgi:acyl-CoA synthetase (NDP forming)
VFELVCDDPNVGSILFAMPADYGESTVSVTTDALAIAGPRGTVLIPVWMSPKHGGGYDVLAAAGFAPFDGLKRAVNALARVVTWVRTRDPMANATAKANAEVGAASSPAHSANPPVRHGLAYADVRERLEGHGLRFPAETFVTSAAQAADAARAIARPVAMKLAAAGLVHKTEVGGVALGVASPDEAAAVYVTMTDPDRLARFGIVADGVYVQEMVGDGIDVLVGVHRDEVFGPILTIGTGGIETEIERDVLHLAIPFTDEQLLRALRPLRLAQRLAGVRGAAAADLAELLRVAHSFATLFVDPAADIAELEVNPLRVVVGEHGTECITLDAVLVGLA